MTRIEGNEDPALDELVEAYQKRDLIIFVGAGVSAAGGLPSWARLVQLLAEHARVRGEAGEAALAEIAELSAMGRHVQALTAVKREIGAPEFGAVIERHLDERPFQVPELAQVIASLAPTLRAVLTTNIDGFLERAFAGTWPVLARAKPDLARRRGFIFKLHGTLLERDTWVFTEDEYERAVYADPTHQTTFSAFFHACPILFVGYGLADDDFEHVLRRVRALAGAHPPRHFALVAAETVKPHRRRKLEEAGVRMIPYANPDGKHGEVVRILRALAAQASQPLAGAGQGVGGTATLREPQPPGGPYDPSWYVHREVEESHAWSHLRIGAGTVFLWGPERFGKSTMVRYLLDKVREDDALHGTRSVIVDIDVGLLLPDPPSFDGLLANMADVLGGEEEGAKLARSQASWVNKLTTLMATTVLPHAGDRLVLVISRADALWSQPFQGKFYAMLRTWSAASHSAPWSRLRLLVELSGAPGLLPDASGKDSPWEIVSAIELRDLRVQQVQELAELYGLDWSTAAIEGTLCPLVGGHPYLLRTIMHHAALFGLALDDAIKSDHLFSDHLERLALRLDGDPELEAAVGQILEDTAASLDERTYQRLRGAGIVVRDPDFRYRIRYKLYETYLRRRWQRKRSL